MPLKRRDLIRQGLAMASLAPLAPMALSQALAGQPPGLLKRKRPNILLIVTDQERQDLPAALPLPGHDWLAEHGRRFMQHHVHTTPCSPSRSTIYTGQHTQHTGVIANIGAPPFCHLSPHIPTAGTLLRELGYHTAYKGKWHLSHIPEGANLGYGSYPSTRNALEPYGFAEYNDDGDPHGVTWTGFKVDGQTAANASRWLRTRGKALSGRQPWFLAVNLVNPHDIMYYDSSDGAQTRTRLDADYLSPLAPPPDDPLYRHDWRQPLPASFDSDSLQGKPWSQRAYVDFCNVVYGRMPRQARAHWGDYQNYYFNCIRDADRHLSTVLNALRESGLDRETVIVFTSDHGEMAGAHGLRQKGPHMYQENVRVPLTIVHPDVRTQAGRETDALSSAIDLVPTLLTLAGEDAARIRERWPALRGVDLSAPIADAAARSERDRRGILFDYNTTLYIDPALVEYLIRQRMPATRLNMVLAALAGHLPSRDNPGFFRGIHDGRYKFARYFRPGQHHTPTSWEMLLAHNELELYDTRSDPQEINNLAAQPEQQRDLILALNARVNALVATEIGRDEGAELPGPGFLYRL